MLKYYYQTNFTEWKNIYFMKNGLIIINKEQGITSQGVVNRVKRILGVKKAGHTGTLDPMATGVLPVLVERGVKASEFMLTSDKHYIATLLLGVTTDTEDVTGEILTESNNIPAEELSILCEGVNESIEAIYKYQNSALGIMDTITNNYENDKLNIKMLQEAVSEMEQSPLVKDLAPLFGL